MKRIIFMIGLTGGLGATGFSQTDTTIKIDTTFKSISINDYPRSHQPGMFKDYKKPGLGPANTTPFKRSAPKDFSPGNNGKLARTKPMDNMPCIHPQGHYPARVYKPDTAVRYTLRVER